MSEIVSRLNAALDGRYRIEREIGAGGMATVYLAHDERHDRPVALKVLRPELAAVVGSERFLSEIRTTANLQHPHILQLYDSGDAEGFLYYVMPYVEGETLREKIDREKQLPIDEAVGLVRAIAGALQAAHEQGVIHRDIKPANILLTHDQPLVADFGIALAVQQAGGGRLTETGLSLGTPFYMSPEQATADRDPDARSDLYSLGCVLYEMLTGEPPFSGATAQAVLGRILTGTLARPTEHRKTIPAHVESVILKALERLPADRFVSAAEFAEALGNPNFRHGDEAPGAAGRGDDVDVAGLTRRNRLLTGATLVLAGALAISLLSAGRGSDAAPRPVEFYVDPDSTHVLISGIPGTVALSNDGFTLAYVGRRMDGVSQIYVRRLDERDARPVPGTEDAHDVFFSPDDAWLGFSTNGLVMRKVRLEGGNAQTIARLAGPMINAHWGTDDRIVYGVTGPEGLMRVSASGGLPEEILVQNDTITGVLDPWLLPGGRVVLVTILKPEPHIVALDLETGDTRMVGPGMAAKYMDEGYLVYGTADGALLAHPFDTVELEFTADPTRIAEGIGGWLAVSADFALSPSGAVAYLRGFGEAGELILMSPSAELTSYQLSEGFVAPRVSPDGDRILYSTVGLGAAFVYSISQETTRLIVSGENFTQPAWSPDGDTIVYVAGPAGRTDLWIAAASGAGEPRRLRDLEGLRLPRSPAFNWDGTWVLYTEFGPRDIFAIRTDGTGDPVPVAVSPEFVDQPTPSPAGPWVAYSSAETGQAEVYVTRFPGDGRSTPISVGGGWSPAWSAGGDTLFYHNGRELIAAALDLGDVASVLSRNSVLPWNFPESMLVPRGYDVHPEGFVARGSRANGARMVVRTGLSVGR